MPKLRIEVLPHGEGLDLPKYETAGSAGLDLRAAVAEDKPLSIYPGLYATIPTGLRLAIPPGYEGQVRPRSGHAAKRGVTVLNAPGTIDSDYRGEVGVILVNHDPSRTFEVERGMRIAQLVIAPVAQVEIETADSLDATERGEGGFGHTGTV